MNRFRIGYSRALCALLLTACGGADAEGRGGDAAERPDRPAASAAPAAPGAAADSAPTRALAETGGGSADAAAPAPAATAPRGAPAVAPGGGAAPAPAPATRTEPDAAAVLRRAEQAYDAVRSMQADFEQVLTVPLLDSSQRSRGTMYHRRPDRFLMRFSQPAGDVVVADGTHLWLFYPSSDPKQVVRTTLAAGGQGVDLQREFLSNPTARFHATLDGTETVAGRAADVLTLTPKQSSPYTRVRIWVDRGDALVRRFEITEQNETVRRLELRNLRPNVALSDQLFRFTPPPGVQVFQQ